MNDEQKAKRLLQDITMRKGLFAYLWGCLMSKQQSEGFTPRPMPIMDDEEIKEELQRIILGK